MCSPFTKHMHKAYEKHRHCSTFTFKVPYYEPKDDLKNKPKFELIRSPVNIKHTFLKALEDCPQR